MCKQKLLSTNVIKILQLFRLDNQAIIEFLSKRHTYLFIIDLVHKILNHQEDLIGNEICR